MLYPPKKRAYSPEPKKTKDLANLVNINSKFTGSGGSIFFHSLRFFFSRTQKANVSSQTYSFWNIQSRKVYFMSLRKMLQQPTLFRKYYERGDLPVAVSFNGALRKVFLALFSLHGKWNLSILIIISTYPFSLKELERFKSPLNFQQFKELMN